jgi:hypothetical protein
MEIKEKKNKENWIGDGPGENDAPTRENPKKWNEYQ